MAAELKLVRTAAEEALVARFPAVKASLSGDATVLRMREAAFDLVARRGLPHRRVEEWKYTDLRGLLREAAPLAAKPAAAEIAAAFNGAIALAETEALRIGFVNGHLAPEMSDLRTTPQGVEILPLAEALAGHSLLKNLSPIAAARENAAYALNTAFMNDGVVIRIAAGTAVERPIHLRFVNQAVAAFSTAVRVLLVVEAGASVTLLETHEGPQGLGYQPNTVVEIVAEDRAVVRHVRLNAEGGEAIALSTLAAKLGAHVFFETVNVAVGAGMARHQVFLTFADEHSTARINGATMLKAKQHGDTTLLVDHAVPHCDSKELFKTVIDDSGTGVFQGKIIVRPQAQKTDGRMMSAALLLSDGGTMNNKPELEIFADDVVCGHGATCGQIDEEMLFFLRSRGIDKAEAERMLIQAFLAEVIEQIGDDQIVAALEARTRRWLGVEAESD
jgi:Fe-S cluster assembly protein SufD